MYEIQDNTGTMEVVGTERWHDIKCERGDKLRLFCFQLKMIDQKLKLTCGTHSFIQVGSGQRNVSLPKEANNFVQVLRAPGSCFQTRRVQQVGGRTQPYLAFILSGGFLKGCEEMTFT